MTADRELSIYIVDDEEALGEMAHQILALSGYEASVFSDPADALVAMRDATEKPVLLITDGMMGSMNGLELIEQFKKVVPAGKSILLSGTITDELMREHTVRPDRFIPKPYSADRLLRTVEELLPPPPSS
jgi:two-component system, cell cycle sensor histidine kinase and response regulator CckA